MISLAWWAGWSRSASLWPESLGPCTCVARWQQAERVIFLQVVRASEDGDGQELLWHFRGSAQGGAWCPGRVSTAKQRPSSTLLRQRPLFAHGTVFISPRLRVACTSAWGEGCSSAAWAVRRTSAFWPCSGLRGASCLGWGRQHPCLGLAHLGLLDKYS